MRQDGGFSCVVVSQVETKWLKRQLHTTRAQQISFTHTRTHTHTQDELKKNKDGIPEDDMFKLKDSIQDLTNEVR